MLTENIMLFKTHNRYIMIDNFTFNIFLLNETTFKILEALKRGLNKGEVEKVFGKNNVSKVCDYINDLKEKKAIYDLKEDFYNSKKIVEGIIPRQPELLEAVFMLVQCCNMQCKYCYGNSGQFGNKSVMSKEMAKKYFEYFLKSCEEHSRQKVKFLGGEPLLNFDIMKYIIELWEQWKSSFLGRNLSFSFTTNGTLFTPEIVQYIKEKKIGVTISLDGPENIQNSMRKFHDGSFTYNAVMRGIDLLEKYEVFFTIRATVTSNENLDELYQYFEEKNFSIVHIIPVDYPMKAKVEDYQWDLKQYGDYVNREMNLLTEGCDEISAGNNNTFKARQMKIIYNDINFRNKTFPFKCSAGWWSAVFSSDGYIYPCHRLVGNKHYRIGDYLKGIEVNKIKEIYFKILEASKKCNFCIAFTTCKRRCMAQMALPDGNFAEISDELCDIYRDSNKHIWDLFFKIRDVVD